MQIKGINVNFSTEMKLRIKEKGYKLSSSDEEEVDEEKVKLEQKIKDLKVIHKAEIDTKEKELEKKEKEFERAMKVINMLMTNAKNIDQANTSYNLSKNDDTTFINAENGKNHKLDIVKRKKFNRIRSIKASNFSHFNLGKNRKTVVLGQCELNVLDLCRNYESFTKKLLYDSE